MRSIFLSGLALTAIANGETLAQPAPAPVPSINVSRAVAEDAGHANIPIAIWAPSTGQGLGLIVISHGTGAGPTAHIDTAQALANSGFVVVAPMHPGDNFQDDSAVGKPQWFVDRSRHVSKVLDYMLNDWAGHTRLDPDRIGIFGMSAGATTALVLAGGNLDLSIVDEHCKAKPEFVCQIMAPANSGSAGELVRDDRIGAEAIAAPGLGFAFTPDSLQSIRIPVQLWAGTADDTVPYATNSGLVRNNLGKNVEFHSVENAIHLSFLAPCGPETPPFLCQDKAGFDRAAFHQDFNRKVVDFFQAHLLKRLGQ